MKPPPILYTRPDTLDGALALLAEHGDEAKALAGGQSLMPLLNFRLARPSVVVDLAMVSELRGTAVRDGQLVLRSMTVQRRAETDPEIAAACPLIPAALRHVGHLQIRNRGTVGGSLAHADPAAELPAVAVAADATVIVQSAAAERSLSATEFFDGPFLTALQPDELLTEVRFPVRRQARTAFLELSRRSGDFALAGVAVSVVGGEDGVITSAAIAGLGVGPSAMRLRGAETAVAGRTLNDEAIADAAAAASAEVSPMSDIHANESYRRHLVGVLLSRALRHVRAPAAGESAA